MGDLKDFEEFIEPNVICQKYVLSYDALSKEKLEEEEGKKIKCKDASSVDCRIILIELLCKINSVKSIEWVNNTTITFESSEYIIKDVSNAINELDYCIDFYLTPIWKNGDNIPVVRKKIRQQKSVNKFKELVDKNCGRLKSGK